MLKSRSGEPVRFIDVIDEAIERGGRGGREEPRPAGRAARLAVGQAVGIGALKYADLSTDRIRDYVFDWERMLSFDGNTAPYLQYAHARICSIFRRAAIDRAEARSDTVPCSSSRRSGRWRCGCSASAAVAETVERQPAPAVHVPLRAGVGLHGVLRALPGAQGTSMPAPGRVAWR